MYVIKFVQVISCNLPNEKAALALAVPIGVLAAFISMFMKNVVMNLFAPLVDKYAKDN
ncbi:PTS sugar transporter subunit IIC, partial [Companilactobacillus kimchii]|uniref:PTS sugar transporter subunit IIC n=1 Tax=Companilactobacillus kimchii TaxID=2801452 RepID=UPI0035237D04